MRRGKSIRTRASEIAKELTKDQIHQLMVALQEEAERPQIDLKKLAGAKRKYAGLHAKLSATKGDIVSIYSSSGMSDEEAWSAAQALTDELAADPAKLRKRRKKRVDEAAPSGVE